MKTVKNIFASIIHVAMLALFIFGYSFLYQKVENYSVAHNLPWLTTVYGACMAFFPALYLRCIIALNRKAKGVQTILALDIPGVLSTVILLLLGAVQLFTKFLPSTQGNVQTYYFLGLWFAVLCSFHRVPLPNTTVPEPAAPQEQPKPFGWKKAPKEEPVETFDALQQPLSEDFAVDIPQPPQEPPESDFSIDMPKAELELPNDSTKP